MADTPTKPLVPIRLHVRRRSLPLLILRSKIQESKAPGQNRSDIALSAARSAAASSLRTFHIFHRHRTSQASEAHPPPPNFPTALRYQKSPYFGRSTAHDRLT